jgi:hypothetical protein
MVAQGKAVASKKTTPTRHHQILLPQRNRFSLHPQYLQHLRQRVGATEQNRIFDTSYGDQPHAVCMDGLLRHPTLIMERTDARGRRAHFLDGGWSARRRLGAAGRAGPPLQQRMCISDEPTFAHQIDKDEHVSGRRIVNQQPIWPSRRLC